MFGAGSTSVGGSASTISGTNQKGLDRILNNTGTMTYSTVDVTTPFYFGLGGTATPGVLNNLGTFNVTAGGDFSQNFGNAGHAINNSGTWNVSGAGTTSNVGVGIAFNNSGAVNILMPPSSVRGHSPRGRSRYSSTPLSSGSRRYSASLTPWSLAPVSGTLASTSRRSAAASAARVG